MCGKQKEVYMRNVKQWIKTAPVAAGQGRGEGDANVGCRDICRIVVVVVYGRKLSHHE